MKSPANFSKQDDVARCWTEIIAAYATTSLASYSYVSATYVYQLLLLAAELPEILARDREAHLDVRQGRVA